MAGMQNQRTFILLLTTILFGCSGSGGKVWDANPRLDLVWTRMLQTPADLTQFPLNHATPVLLRDRGLLVAASSLGGKTSGRLCAFTSDGGDEVWCRDFAGPLYSLAADGDWLLAGTEDGELLRLAAADGSQVYEQPPKVTGPVSVPLIASGDRLLVRDGVDGLWCFEKTSGKLLWNRTRQLPAEPGIRGRAAPVVDGGSVYVGWTDGTAEAYSLTDGSTLWSRQLCDAYDGVNDSDLTSVVLAGGEVLAGCQSAGLFLLGTGDGAIRRKVQVERPLQGTASGNVLYLTTASSMLLAFSLPELENLWSLHLWKSVTAAPVLCGGNVVLSTDDALALVDASSGRFLRRYQSEFGVSSPVLCDGDTLFFLTDGGQVTRAELY